MKHLFSFIKKQWQSYWVKSGFFALIGKSSSTIFGFLNFFLLVRTLSPEDYGTWILFTLVCGILEMLKAGFIGNPLIRFASGEKGEKYTEIISSALLLNAIITVVQIGVLYAISGILVSFWEAPRLDALFKVYMISMVLLIFQSHYGYLLPANFNFKGGLWINLIRQLTTFFFLIAAFLFKIDYSLLDLAITQLIGVFLSTIVSFIVSKEYASFLSFSISKNSLKRLSGFGKYTFGTTLSSTILKSVDSWMLGSLVSKAAVGYYNPAIRLSNLFEIPTTTLTSIAFPQLVNRIKKEGEASAKHLYEKSVGYITAMTLPLVLFVIIFAEPVILIIAGKDYLPSVDILRITMLYGLLIPFNRQVGITLDALNKPHMNFLIVVRDTVMNTVLNYLFIKQWGLIGAALATFTTYFVTLIWNQYYINKLVGVKTKRIFYFMGVAYKTAFAKSKELINNE